MEGGEDASSGSSDLHSLPSHAPLLHRQYATSRRWSSGAWLGSECRSEEPELASSPPSISSQRPNEGSWRGCGRSLTPRPRERMRRATGAVPPASTEPVGRKERP